MTEWNPDNPADLGVWDDLEWTKPPPAKKRKSLKLKKKAAGSEKSRFVSPLKDLQVYQQPFCPKNTKVSTKWALNNFEDWAANYNARHPDSPCPDKLLLVDDAQVLSHWLQKFVLSTRKKSGEKYPPKTIQMLLCGLQRYMKEKKESPFNIFSTEIAAFKQLMTTLDSLYRELREEGVGATSQPTQLVTDDDIDRLWSSNVLSLDTPQGLLNAVFFYNGNNFLLRGGIEHRELKLSQVKKNTSPEGRLRYTYTEIVQRIEAVVFAN